MFPANGTTTINRNAHTLTATNGRVKGVMGAIVNNGSRIGNEEQLAMEMAVQDFNNYTNQTLVLHIRSSRGEPVTAALAAVDLISTQHAEVIVGPQTWEEFSVVAQFVAASPNLYEQMNAIAAIVESWEWTQVTVIYEDIDSSATGIIPHLSDALKEKGAEISLCGSFVYAFGPESFQNREEDEYDGRGLRVKRYSPAYVSHFQDFYERFGKRFSLKHPEEENPVPGFHALQAYDAIWTVCTAMNESKNGSELPENSLRSDFHGLTGNVRFANQTAVPARILQIVNVRDGSYKELGFWSNEFGYQETIDHSTDHDNSSMKGLGQMFWPGGTFNTPNGWTLPTTLNWRAHQILIQTNFDAAVGDIAITAARYKYTEFPPPYTESGLRNHCSEPPRSPLNQAGTLLCHSFTTVVSVQGSILHSNLSRMTMVVWLFVALVITQTYTANLASILTEQKLEPTLSNLESLKKNNAMVGHSIASFVSKFLVDVLHLNPKNMQGWEATGDREENAGT
ncbi:hypothetical protein Patl1_04770 [Pistacia atlantica]|uniref:Uncharacterized protein n=1 Tax=Pistacia atlantica TaxID=434234 RepID=A0ACC1BSN1_9ROSI|nr:hypothetical protein Patl1_04770 [Pistacia atlantica]